MNRLIKPDERAAKYRPPNHAQSADGFSPEGMCVMVPPTIPDNSEKVPSCNSEKTNPFDCNGPSHERKGIIKTLLVLEDEPSLMKLLRHMLKDFSLIEASNAEQALGLFLNRDRQIDLLVADVTLPTSSGIQVALLLRSVVPDLPVLLTSGYPVSGWNNRDYGDLGRLGSTSVAVLTKPFQTQDLLTVVREMIGAVPSGFASTA